MGWDGSVDEVKGALVLSIVSTGIITTMHHSNSSDDNEDGIDGGDNEDGDEK